MIERLPEQEEYLIALLYATGEAHGGEHNTVHLDLCGTAAVLINGRIAGKQATTQKLWM